MGNAAETKRERVYIYHMSTICGTTSSPSCTAGPSPPSRSRADSSKQPKTFFFRICPEKNTLECLWEMNRGHARYLKEPKSIKWKPTRSSRQKKLRPLANVLPVARKESASLPLRSFHFQTSAHSRLVPVPNLAHCSIARFLFVFSFGVPLSSFRSTLSHSPTERFASVLHRSPS